MLKSFEMAEEVTTLLLLLLSLTETGLLVLVVPVCFVVSKREHLISSQNYRLRI